MKKDLLTFAALQIIAAANPDGFTVNAKTLEPIKTGFAVAVAETQNSFNNSGLKKVIKYTKAHTNINAVGGWYNRENKKYYFDATIICDTLEEAVALGRLNKQIAVFNLDKMQEIKIQ